MSLLEKKFKNNISIIIPCFKDSKTLERAILSITNQSFPINEIIVINDCSPETKVIEKIVSKFEEVSYFKNPKNIGLAASKNIGIKNSTKKFVAFLDADDEYLPDKILTQIESFRPNHAVTCNTLNVRINGSHYFRRKKTRLITKQYQILFKNTLNGAGIFIEKKILKKIGGFDDKLLACEDFDLWLRLLKQNVKIIDIGKPLYKYYFNPKGLSKNLLNISNYEFKVILNHECENNMKSTFSYQFIKFLWLLRQLVRAYVSKENNLYLFAKSNAELLNSFFLILLFKIIISLTYPILWIRIYFNSNRKYND